MIRPITMLHALVFAGVALALPAASAAAQGADGKALYESNCRKCHGALGVPPKAMQTKFKKIKAFDAAFVAKHSKDEIVTAMVKGTSDDMKSFKEKLSPDQMALVAAYVHELAAAKAP